MSKSPWIKWFPGDFLNGVAELEPNEIAVYTIVLMRIYDEGGPIPDDAEKIARRCNMRPSSCERALEGLVDAGKLCRVDGHLTNNRAEKVIETRQKVVEKSAQSARTRWEKEREKPNEINSSAVRPHDDRMADAYAIQKPEARDSLPSVESGAAPPPERSKARKGTRLPPDWTPSEPTIAYAESQGFSRSEALRIAEKFRNYWVSATKNAVKLDWHATWRNWVMTEQERLGKAPLEPPPAINLGAWPLSFPEDVCRRAFLDDRWLIGMGPEPGYGGCKVPRDVQERWMAEKAERKGRAA